MRILTFFFLLIFGIYYTQTVVSGTVFNKRGKPQKDISVTLKDTYDGATTTADGKYSFSTSETGEHILVFSGGDFEEFSKKIILEGKSIEINIQLKSKVNEIDAVVITAGAIEASDKKRATAILKPLDIYTTPGADGQVTSALTTLPGVQKVGETEGLFVRGGTGTESKIFFDGNLVNNYFTSSTPGIAGRERFNTSLFKGNIFSSGGYSALYGQALSSVLILESIDIPDRSSYNFGISPLFASANMQRVNKELTKSYGASASYSNLTLMTKLLKWETEFETAPNGFSVDFNMRWKTKNGIIKYYTLLDHNTSAVFRPTLELGYDKDGFGVQATNNYHQIHIKERMGKYKLEGNLSYAYNDNHLNISQKIGEVKTEINNIELQSHYINSKLVIDRKIKVISAIRGGIESNMSFENSLISPRNVQSFTQKYREHLTSLFAETDMGLSNNFSIKLGARSEYSSFLNRWNFAPKLATTYRLSKDWLASFAYGKYFQNPESKYLFNANPDALQYQSASHYIFQIQKNSEGQNLRLEAFYKNYEKLMKTSTINYQQVLTNVDGNGYAKGIELLWKDKKTFKDIDYWVSYSYLDSERQFLNYPTSLFPSFAAKHTASLVAKKFVMKWKTGFNLSYTYTNGRPWYNFAGGTQGILKDYNALNFSVNYLPNLGKKNAKAFTVFVLSINNVLNNKNIYGMNFSNDGQRMSPNLPPANRFIFIGAFISIGVDRTQDAINNNL